MNRIFRIIWSKALGTWVVASELTARHGKSGGACCAPLLAEGRIHARVCGPRIIRLSVLTALLALHMPAHAQSTQYWDGNGTSPGSGGSGMWNTSSLLWSPNNDGVSGPYSAWNNSAFGGAAFNGTAGTVTLGGPINANSLSFGTTGYVLTGSTLTLGGTTPSITVTGTNNTFNATINSVLAGSAGLTIAGGSTGAVLTLNAANTFTGGLTLNGASLTFNGDASLGAASNTITTSGTSILTNNGSTALNASRTVNISSGTLQLVGGSSSADLGAALYTGAGSLLAGQNVNLSNNNNSYTGTTTFTTPSLGSAVTFTSIRDVGGGPSSLGAPTTIANGTIAANVYLGSIVYTGSGDSSNRNWSLNGAYYSGQTLVNGGTGTLTLTLSGNIVENYTTSGYPSGVGYYFKAQSADLVLSGIISSTVDTTKNFAINYFTGSSTNRSITLGGANTYTSPSQVNNVTVNASTLANTGNASSFGTATEPLGSNAPAQLSLINGVVNYTGAGASTTDYTWSVQNGSGINNNSAGGAVTLTGTIGFAAGSTNTLTLGGSYAGVNTISSAITGSGSLAVNGGASDVWLLSGANTYTGTNTVNGGTLRAGSAQALGAASNAMVVNGGTLDLGGYDTTLVSLAGTGGTVALGANNLTVSGTTSTSYAGSLTGSGSFTKRGTGTLTLSGASTYTGATVVNGGTLALNFAGAGAPTSNIIANASTLTMSGGTLAITGAASQANSQAFSGMVAAAGTNTISATSGTGGSATLNLGAISSTGGLVNFVLPASGSITTTNPNGALGWATVNGTDYAQVTGGVINAFNAYTNQDNAALWANGNVVSDAGGAANSPYFGSVAGSVQLGGMKYTAAAGSTVTVGAGNTLGVNGTIIVGSTVGANNDTIAGGNLTGPSGGGTLGIAQNSTGSFTIGSTITDNSGAIGFTKAGTGQATLSGSNTYTGPTTLSGGQLNVSTIGNGGAASNIGASSNAPSNLVIQNGTLSYTGGTATTDRGFNLVNGGPTRTISVTNGAANLTFTGLVTSPDNADLTKTGAGTLTLSNAANNYVGATTIAGGELSVNTLANGGSVSGIGASSNASSNLNLSGGGALQYTGATTSTDHGFTLGTGNGGFDVANAATVLTVGGTGVGTGALIKNGPGTLVLGGTNTFTGGSIVNTGTLRAGSTQAFGTGAMTIAPAATVDLAGINNTIGGLNDVAGGGGGGSVALGGATLTISSGGNATFSGAVTGAGNVIVGSQGTQTFNGCNNTYTGSTTITSALTTDCLANGGSPSGIGASSNASSNLVFNNGRLTYTGVTVSTDRGFTNTGGATINVNNAATTLTFSGVATGAAAFTKDGSGTLVLSGNNTLTGGTNIVAGTLRAGSATALSTNGTTVQSGATLDLNGFSSAFNSLAGSGNVTLGAGTLTVNGFYGNTWSGVISGTGGVSRIGGGYPEYFNGCLNTYTGVTNVNGSTLAVQCLANAGQASGIGAATASAANLIIAGAGTLQYVGTGGSSGTTDRLFSLGTTGGTLDSSGTGAVSFTNTGAIGFTTANTSTLSLDGTNTGTNTLGGTIGDANATTGQTTLAKNGVGDWVLTGNNTYTGNTVINQGRLWLGNGGTTGSVASNNIIIVGGTLAVNRSNTVTLNSLISGAGGVQQAGTGTTVLTNVNNTYSGDTSITAGTLQVASDAVLGASTGGVTINGGALRNSAAFSTARAITLGASGGTFDTQANFTVTSAIGGSGGLSKINTGTLTLTGANTYTGPTTVQAGTLLVDGNQAAATGATTVQSGGTLGGNGTLGGDVTIASGGALNPGDTGAVGALTINGNLALNSGAALNYQFGQANTPGGALNDLTSVNGNLTLGGTLNVNTSPGGSFSPGVYRIINYAGTLTNNGLSIGSAPAGTYYVQTSVNHQVNLVNSTGLTLNYWDGAAGPKNNAAVDGGNGTWQNASGNDNWADSTGQVNAPYANGAFAVFEATPGTVRWITVSAPSRHRACSSPWMVTPSRATG